MKVTAYQTLEDRDNVDEIELDGPFKCTHSGAWLGHGYYFWDTDINWAHDWGRIAHKKFKREYLICRAGVKIDEFCFDLVGSVAHRKVFVEIFETLKASGFLKNKGNILVAQIIEYLKQKGIFEYAAIRADDFPSNVIKVYFRNDKRNARKGMEHTVLNTRVQICLIDKKNLVLPYRVIYPEKYVI